jgi:hypothetical protein
MFLVFKGSNRISVVELGYSGRTVDRLVVVSISLG